MNNTDEWVFYYVLSGKRDLPSKLTAAFIGRFVASLKGWLRLGGADVEGKTRLINACELMSHTSYVSAEAERLGVDLDPSWIAELACKAAYRVSLELPDSDLLTTDPDGALPYYKAALEQIYRIRFAWDEQLNNPLLIEDCWRRHRTNPMWVGEDYARGIEALRMIMESDSAPDLLSFAEALRNRMVRESGRPGLSEAVKRCQDLALLALAARDQLVKGLKVEDTTARIHRQLESEVVWQREKEEIVRRVTALLESEERSFNILKESRPRRGVTLELLKDAVKRVLSSEVRRVP